jgi:hypothetical protein
MAPGLVTGFALFSIPTTPFMYFYSLRAFSWWFRHVSTPASGQGTVYGISCIGTEAMGKKQFDDLKAQQTQRPDLSGGSAGDVSEDKQDRFWKDSGFDPKKAKKQLESDAQWRSKMGVDNILSVRRAAARHPAPVLFLHAAALED